MQVQLEQLGSTPSHQEDDEIFDYAGAVRFLNGPTKATLQDWVATGRYGIPFIKLGHFVRFRKSSLRAWLKARERNTHINQEIQTQ